MSTLRSTIAHKASNRDVFPSRVAPIRQAEFFNSIQGFRNESLIAGFSSILALQNYIALIFDIATGLRNR